MTPRTLSVGLAAIVASACSHDPQSCADTGTCVPATCQRPVGASSLPGAQVISLGSHKVGDVVPFTVPAGTASMTIIHQAQTAGLEVVLSHGDVWPNNAVPGQLIRPDGTIVYDDNDQKYFAPPSSDGGVDSSGLYVMYGLDSPNTAAFTIPNTTASLNTGVPAGTWKFVVHDWSFDCSRSGSGCQDGGANTGTYDVSVLLKAAPSPNLDIAFYIVGDATTINGQPFTAANAPNDRTAKRLISTMTSIFAAAGITLRNVSWFDAPADAKARFGSSINVDNDGPCDNLDQMFTLSGAHPGNTVNLFLVHALVTAHNGGGQVVGVDGTIPGPASLSGTIHSGAAVSLSDLFFEKLPTSCTSGTDLAGCGADLVAFIAAHETGHFLGLFHPTESHGVDFDGLSDTPKCPCALCASSTDKPRCDSQSSNPVFLDATLCTGAQGPACAGGDNLMFWQLDPAASQGKVTPQQAAVMMLSPALQ